MSDMKMNPIPSLTIQIPGAGSTIENLIKRLRYLETRECRAAMSEEVRVSERKFVTAEFQKALIARDFFKRVSAYHDRDDIYS
jgi:hypothetical protein